MNKINLEYTTIPVLLPNVSFFTEKINNNEVFHFLRINHAILDLIHLAYPPDNLLEFESDILQKRYDKIAQKIIESSHKDIYNNSFEMYHNNSKQLQNILIVFLKILNEYKTVYNNLYISVSLGVGLGTFYGVWPEDHIYQIGRTNIWEIIDKNKKDEFYYSGVIKNYSITGEIFSLFEQLNKNNFLVVFLGPEYFGLYGSVFKTKNYKHITIPNCGAIEYVDDYINQILSLKCNNQKIIVFTSIGHILSAYISYKLINENVYLLDTGRSFDIILKQITDTMPSCWNTYPIEKLLEHTNYLRTQSYG